MGLRVWEFWGEAGEAGDSDEGDGEEEEGCGDELEVAVPQVFKDQLDGDQGEGGVGDPGEFSAAPTGAGKTDGEREGAGDQGADEGDVVDIGREA